MKINKYNPDIAPVRIHEQMIYTKLSVRLFNWVFTKLFKIFSIRFVLNLLRTLAIFLFNSSYQFYLINLNIFYLRVITVLKNADSKGYFEIKEEWCKYLIEKNLDKREVKTAKLYIDLLRQEVKENISSTKKSFSRNNIKTFYIYGPNSNQLPSKDYRNQATLILTKPAQFDISHFKKKYLMMNHFSSHRLTNNYVKTELAMYDEIFAFTNAGIKSNIIQTISTDIGGNIASDMGLTRILHYLSKNYPESNVVIDGFDLYLSKQSYSEKLLSHIEHSSTLKAEKAIAISLFEHDMVFNFLRIKMLLKSLNIIDSEIFLKNLNQTSQLYLDSIINVRRFDLIK